MGFSAQSSGGGGANCDLSNVSGVGDIEFSGTLTVDDLHVVSGDSIHLGDIATFSSHGHYASVNTNWMVQHDDQTTAFIGVYAESTETMTHANLVLDAQGSALNVLKNSPIHPWSPNAAGIINEDGSFAVFVEHDQDISFMHFGELTKDEYGNVTYLTDIHEMMRLRSHTLLLEDVDLQIEDTDVVKVKFSATEDSFLNSGHNLQLLNGGELEFSSQTGMKLDLYGGNYAIGVQSSELRIASNEDIIFYTSGYDAGTEIARIEADGRMKVTGGVRAPEFWAPSGSDLKLQPDVGGNVTLFEDTDVGNGDNSKMLYLWRKAPEGNKYLRFYIGSSQVAYMHASCPLTLQAQQPFTINSVTDDINFKMGDNAGSKKVYFQDSDNAAVASIDSLGNAQFNGTLAVGIATPDYTAHLAAQDTDVVLTLERLDDIIGMGYGIGALLWKAGETTPTDVAMIRILATENWTDTSSPTRMTFSTTPSGSQNYALALTLDENQDAHMEGNLTVGGSVGIGGVADQLPLEVFSADDKQMICVDTTAQAQGVGGGIAFGANATDAGPHILAGEINCWKTNSISGDYGFDMHLETQNSTGTLTYRMTFTSDGKCSIGDSTVTPPTKTLDVLGDARIRGDLTVDDLLNGMTVSGEGNYLNLGDWLKGDLDNGYIAVDSASGKPSGPERFYVNGDVKVGKLEATSIGVGTNLPREEVHLFSDHPAIMFEEADGGSNEKVWELGVSGEEFWLKTANDSYTGTSTVWRAAGRGGTSVTEFSFPNANVAIGTSTVGDSPLKVTGLTEYASNTAAISGGLAAGEFYRNGASTDKVCVVH